MQKTIEVLNGYKVINPILVKIEHDGTGFIGTIKDLGLSFLSDTHDEIIRELKKKIIELDTALRGKKYGAIGGKPKKWKKFLEESITNE